MDRTESLNNLNRNQNNDNGSTTSNTAYNLISSINTNTTNIADSTTVSGSSLTTSSSSSPNNNEQQNYMDQLAQFNKLQATLARGNQMFDSNYRFNNQCQYMDLNNQMSNQMPTQIPQHQPTTAFLVQTPNGSALLIPPTNNFQTLNTFSLNRQTYLPQNLPNSPSCTSGNFRPESNPSQNVYQTIDAEKNGYLYPLDGFYDTTTSFTNTCSTRNKFKKNYHQQQQQGQLTKLIENTQNTIQSSNNTNSAFFTSPSQSNSSTRNRRHLDSSFLERLKFGFSKKLEKNCSWKCLSFLFLFIILNLFTFTMYLAVMRMYNLNWHLKDNQSMSQSKIKLENKPLNLMLFTKIGDTIEDLIQPSDFFNMQFFLDTSTYIKFNISLSPKSQIGFYADKTTPPTYTKFKIFEAFNGNSLINKKQQSNLVNTGFVHYLEQGLWYISLLNDNKNPIKFRLKTDYHTQLVSNCPKNCFGKGDCVNNKCQCYPGFSGSDCSQATCPVLCNGHGRYENGKCICDILWHGSECETPIDQCEVANCNKNGECMNGKCMCYPGYDGKFCEIKTCLSPNCSNNGICLNGQCVCFTNYTGADCSFVTNYMNSVCSSNGKFNYATKSCECYKNWKGPDCSTHENCLDSSCLKCKNGWSGLNCLIKVPLTCDSRCSSHGICLNGTCSCSPGYQGRNCDINNCPNGCSSNGICERVSSNKYQCVCKHGWTGKSCEVAIEMVCNDDIDNDGDGLTDCMDSECCIFDNCKLSLACQTSPEPKDRLLRKQPPSLSASFFDKMRFLIEDSSVQSFAYSNSFLESQVTVIRGQVLFKNGQPLIGVKVSSYQNPSYGYTLTRNNGIFDLMINGGGAIQLEFSKNRLKTKIISINANWNQFVYIDTVVMYLSQDLVEPQNEFGCLLSLKSQPTINFRPIVRTNWKEIRTHYEKSPLVAPDTGVVKSEIQLSEPSLKLIYTSNLVQGYMSSIFIQLTGDEIPEELQIIHLEILIEGVLHKQQFDAYTNLKYEYSWDRRNAYEQRVYGFTNANVKVGYQYENCQLINWQYQVVKIAGYDLGSSEIGNWNLNIHHRLNTQQGILHKGDGSTIYLRDLQKSLDFVSKFDSEVLSISINKDGLVFIGDTNYIWMLNNTEQPKQLLIHNFNKYYMTSDPVNGNLFLSNLKEKQIVSLKSFEQSDNFKINFKIELDGISYPKGLVIDKNQNLYFIDGTGIKILKDGQVKILINNQRKDKPIPCKKIFKLDEKFSLFWPTVLAINPIDNLLYILDDGIVYKMDLLGNIEVVVGRPFLCDDKDVNFEKLNNPIDMSFSPDGDLFILENKSEEKIRQIRLFKTTGEIEIFYSNLKNPQSISVHQNRSVYVLDNNVLYQIKNNILKDEYNGKYTIISSDSKEAYIFNRFGLHLNTINLKNGANLFNFTYNGNALYGKLTQVTDQNKILLNIKRDFHGRTEMLQLSSQSYRVKLNNFDMLRTLVYSNDKSINLNYIGNSGLLSSRNEPGSKSYFYQYEKNGKVKEIVESLNSYNRTMKLNYDISQQGLTTSFLKQNGNQENWSSNSSGLFVFDASQNLDYKYSVNLNYKSVLYDDLISLLNDN